MTQLKSFVFGVIKITITVLSCLKKKIILNITQYSTLPYILIIFAFLIQKLKRQNKLFIPCRFSSSFCNL